MALERIVPEDWGWQHIEEGEENAPTHIRASLMGPSVLVPLRDDGDARARDVAGDLLLRVRRAARALGARQRAGRCAAVDARSAARSMTRSRPATEAIANGVPSADGRAGTQGRGARGQDRLARLRRQRRRARRGLCRLRPRRAPRRPRPGPRDQGEARLRRGDPHVAPRARPRSRRGALPPLRHLRRLPLPGLRVRAPARGEAAPGARRAHADRRLRRAAARADRPCALAVRVPEQARVLVRARPGRPRARLPPRRTLGRGHRRRGMPAHDASSATRSARRSRRGRAARASSPTTRTRRPATSVTSSSARAGTRDRFSSSS